MIYDFRPWRSIEATGRLGADEGIDIQATEIVNIPRIESEDEQLDEERSIVRESDSSDRIWVIQCKREKSIGPKEIRTIVRNNFASQQGKLFGYLLVAACDFSKRTRDSFRQEMLNQQVQEFHLWGKAELEDMLFLPKNDHLLFAYFGISLQIRRRSLKTLLRSRLALKRRLIKEIGHLSGFGLKPVLIRDPRDEDYPNIGSIEEFVKAPRWRYWQFRGHEPLNHLAFVFHQYLAFVDWEQHEYDLLEDYDADGNQGRKIFGIQNSWGQEQIIGAKWSRFWDQIPEDNRARAYVLRAIHYDQILEIDELGDVYHEGPHLLVEYRSGDPFEPGAWCILESSEFFMRRSMDAEEARRIKFFPEVIPDT